MIPQLKNKSHMLLLYKIKNKILLSFLLIALSSCSVISEELSCKFSEIDCYRFDYSSIDSFKDSVDEAQGLFGRPSSEEVERAVSVHEAGHLLGLVNLVYTSNYDHEDPEHPHHSNNDNSVMYWAIESNDVGNFIFGTIPDEFDQYDKLDLQEMASGSLKCKNQLWS